MCKLTKRRGRLNTIINKFNKLLPIGRKIARNQANIRRSNIEGKNVVCFMIGCKRHEIKVKSEDF